MSTVSQDMLLNRVGTLLRGLSRIDRALNGRQEGKTQIDEKLRERVRLPFNIRVQEQQKNVRAIQEQARNNENLLESWNDLRNAEIACTPLFHEALAVLQGALARSAVLDDGLCPIADALIAEVGTRIEKNWLRFTILAEGEAYNDIAEIIRVQFPAPDIWMLPVCAHEFGHFMSSRLNSKDVTGVSHNEFQEFLQTRTEWGDKTWSFFNEYFADLFATYALGPSYAYTSILLRFKPFRAYEDEGEAKHPSFAKRVYVILKTLEQMDTPEQSLPYTGIIEQLRGYWEQTVESLDQPASLDVSIEAHLDEGFDDMYDRLKRVLPSLMYSGWNEAQGLSSKLLDDPKLVVLSERSMLADMLNAAWLCRMGHWQDSEHISKNAMTLCQNLIAKRQAAQGVGL